MSYQKYIDKMNLFQKFILYFIDNEDDNELNFLKLKKTIDDEKIINDQYEFKSLLHLILQISNNHHRTETFYLKIEKILSLFINQIQNYFTNEDIFNIFKGNKRIILFLIEEKILIFNNLILKKISKNGYDKYFLPEINLTTQDIDEDFYTKRKSGENDQHICELIRKDLVKEFIIFINKRNISLRSTIPTSIYETNEFLIKNKNHSLIEYAAFFGSIQIFQYLKINGVELTPTLMIYAIHGQNADLIHLLESEKEFDSYEEYLIESIKCHHNEFVKYFQNFIQKDIKNFSSSILKHYNFELIQNDFFSKEIPFFDLCKNDYVTLAELFLSSIDANKENETVTKLTKEEISQQPSLSYIRPPNSITKKKTSLIVAVEKENVDIIKLLLSCDKIDVNYMMESYLDNGMSSNQMSAFHIAIEKENIDIIKLLLSCKNIDVNAVTDTFIYPNEWQKSALHIAVEKENLEIVEILLNCKNVDVNLYMNQNSTERYGLKERKTALYMAVEQENLDLVKLLCSNENINIDIRYRSTKDDLIQSIPPTVFTIYEKTPLQLAADIKNKKIYQFLLSKKII